MKNALSINMIFQWTMQQLANQSSYFDTLILGMPTHYYWGQRGFHKRQVILALVQVYRTAIQSISFFETRVPIALFY